MTNQHFEDGPGDHHDDGLVHSHGWAAETKPPHERTAQIHRPAPPEHDDGLIHGHAWACGERGRAAH